MIVSPWGDGGLKERFDMLSFGLLSLMCALTSGVYGFGVDAPPDWTWEKASFFFFLLLAAVNSTGIIAVSVQAAGNELSRACLITAIAALGMKTRLKELVAVGVKPVALMVGETALLAALVIGYLEWMR